MQQERTQALQLVYEVIDTAAAGALLVGLFVLVNLRSAPHGIEPFLRARITVGNAALCVLFLTLWHFVFRISGVYEPTSGGPFLKELHKIFAASFVAGALALIFPLISRTHSFTWLVASGFWVSATAFTLGTRLLEWPIRKCFGRKPRQIIIVGSGPRALSLYERLEQDGATNFRVVGFVDSPNGHVVPEMIRARLLSSLEHFDSVLMNWVVDHVMIALPVKSCYDDIQRTIAVCEQAGVESEYLPDVFTSSFARLHYGAVADHPVVRLTVVREGYGIAVKRIIDIVLSAIALVCLAPLMAGMAVAIKLTSPGPAFFIQTRFGLNKRRFSMYKFRTMVANAEALQASLETQNEAPGPVFKMTRDPRITPLGRFLRKTSLDELPQLWNVLRGEMSLVGPRPLPARDVARFDNHYLMRRFSVKPGLTCLWQINGRSNTDFGRWISLDLQYIDNWSLALDLKILAKTVPVVVKGTGAK